VIRFTNGIPNPTFCDGHHFELKLVPPECVAIAETARGIAAGMKDRLENIF
jgi:hypothetical protein